MAYDPNDPFGAGLSSGATGMLRTAGQQGLFDPLGSPRLRAAFRSRLLAKGAARRRRAGLLARLSGMDQLGTQNALQNTEQDIAGDTANEFGNFDLSNLQKSQDFYGNLFNNQLRNQQEQELARRQQRSGFWGGVGSLIGGPVASYLTGFLPQPKK